MSNVQLHTWLNNPHDFDMGLRLLSKFCPGKHTAFKKNAKKYGGNSFYRKKLFALIKDANDCFIPDQKKSPLGKSPKKKNLDISRADFPPTQQLLWDEKTALLKEAAYWHSRVLLLNPHQQAAAITLIINNQIAIDSIWEQLEYFFINKTEIPVKKQITQTEYFAALRRLHTLRTYKSKYRYAPEKWAKHEKEFHYVTRIVNEAKDKY